MDCGLRGSFIHGIFQARVLEWVAISFSRGSSQLRDRIQVSHVVGRCFTVWATKEALVVVVVTGLKHSAHCSLKIKSSKNWLHANISKCVSYSNFEMYRKKERKESEVAQLCPTLRDPMDCSLPGSSVHGIFEAVRKGFVNGKALYKRQGWLLMAFSPGSHSGLFIIPLLKIPAVLPCCT